VRAVVTELQSLIAKERTLGRMKAGTPNGRLFKQLVLRYLRVVARPLNSCIAKLLVADTTSEIDEVIRCVDSTQRAQASLQRSLNAALKKMAVRRSKCGSSYY
jgi:hypothetical protein